MATSGQPHYPEGYQDGAESFDGQPVNYWLDQLEQSPNPDQRYRAHVALHSILPPSQAAPLHVRGLKDADPSVRAYAAKSLGDSERRVEGDDPSVQEPFGAAVGPLKAVLNDDDPDVRFEAARALVRIGAETDAVVPVLLELLNDAGIQPLIRAVIADVLGSLPEAADQTVPLLQQMLHDERTEVRESATASLGRFGAKSRPAVPDLVELLDDEEPFVRENAALALGLIGDQQAVPALRTAMQDEDEGVKTTAAEAIQRLQHAE
jgi:HEAT repeat protein